MVHTCGGWISRCLDCIYASNGSGQAVRKDSGACFLCDPQVLFQAMTHSASKGHIIRHLKRLRLNNLSIYNRLWTHSTLTLLDDAQRDFFQTKTGAPVRSMPATAASWPRSTRRSSPPRARAPP